MKKSLFLSFLIVISLQYSAYCQTSEVLSSDFVELDFGKPKEYNIKAVNVKGAERRDDNAIRSITGLRAGNKITMPGNAIPDAIRKLWRLKLFSDVSILRDSLVGDDIFLTIFLKEQPILTRYHFLDIKKGKQEKIVESLGETLRIGGIVTENDKALGSSIIQNYFIDKGYLDTRVFIRERIDTSKENSVILEIVVDKADKIKIENILFEGNEAVSAKKLRKLLKGTKRKKAFLRKSKFVSKDFEEDKKNIIDYYTRIGHSDALILFDSLWRDESGQVNLLIKVEEGAQYKFGNITWKGNSIYSDEQLDGILGINKGEIFDPELLTKRLEFSLDGRDISSIYMDNGYLFFNVNPTQIAIREDSIDLEMRMYEGPQATVDRVIIKGNDRTHENVIRRVIRTKPGEKFSRSQMIRSQREIINLGYFDPETLQMTPKPNYERGTVDMEFVVEERPSDQLELSAGYGGFQGLIGTLGVTFNNFSIQNIRNKATWSPLPTGDGQRVSLRLQSNSRFFRSYNFSFTEPWLGGKKPNSFSVGAASSSFDNSSFGAGKLGITRLFVGLGTSLKFPDDFFISSTTINIEKINLDNFSSQFVVNNGNFKNFNIRQTISRSSVANPMFPMSGSKVALTVQFTPPYSLFRRDNFWLLNPEERSSRITAENLTRGVRNKLEGEEANAFIEDLEESRKFEWLEYHKWTFNAEWYFNMIGKLVFMTSIKLGFLGSYNNAIGDVPFERFEVGGDGLSNQNSGITGTDIISLRGYEVQDIDPTSRASGGGTIFNKYTAELRYPLSTNPQSTIYTLLFVQGGNQWKKFRDYNPFDMKRSVGVGLRVFLPMFGLLGFDYGFGLDKIIPNDPNPSFGALGKFSIILGFEPD